MRHWDKTILTVLMKFDYCRKERGVSCDKIFFFDSLQKLVEHVIPFWYDEYLPNLDTLQEIVMESVVEHKPDLVFFVPYTDQFTIETLELIKSKHPTFAWFGDDQWRFETYASKYAPHYTYISTTDPWSLTNYNRIGIKPFVTQWAARDFSDQPDLLNESNTYEHTISFVGLYSDYRHWFVEYLRKHGFNVDCYGVGWPNGRITFEDMNDIFRKTMINLNISNSISHDIRFITSGIRNLSKYINTKKTVEQMKARNFEIPLAGGFELTNYVLGLERYFRLGEEIAVYGILEECIKQIDYYLEHDEERRLIVARGRQRARDEHTYLNRLADILEKIWPQATV